jgi:hypothetical protein
MWCRTALVLPFCLLLVAACSRRPQLPLLDREMVLFIDRPFAMPDEQRQVISCELDVPMFRNDQIILNLGIFQGADADGGKALMAQVTDPRGKLIHDRRVSRMGWDLADIGITTGGIYLLRLIDPDGLLVDPRRAAAGKVQAKLYPVR